MPQQVVINGIEFARRSESISGELPAADLVRLHDLLVDRQGSVRYMLDGRMGSRGEALLHLRIEGFIAVQCQRCMDRLDHALELDLLFQLLPADAEMTQDEVEDDSRDYLPAEGEIDVPALIEDEIILSLPVAPRHDCCSVPSPCAAEGKDSPFAALASLKPKIH